MVKQRAVLGHERASLARVAEEFEIVVLTHAPSCFTLVPWCRLAWLSGRYWQLYKVADCFHTLALPREREVSAQRYAAWEVRVARWAAEARAFEANAAHPGAEAVKAGPAEGDGGGSGASSFSLPAELLRRRPPQSPPAPFR